MKVLQEASFFQKMAMFVLGAEHWLAQPKSPITRKSSRIFRPYMMARVTLVHL